MLALAKDYDIHNHDCRQLFAIEVYDAAHVKLHEWPYPVEMQRLPHTATWFQE
jgi:hypothetical protein